MIAKFFLKNKILLIVLTVIFFVGGLISFFTIPRNEDPGFKIRVAVISTPFPGANAKQVDRYVSKKIMDSVEQMGEVEHVRCRSKDELSTVYVELYERYRNLRPIWEVMRHKVDDSLSKLPAGVKPSVNDEFGDVLGIIIAVMGDDYEYWELEDIAKATKNSLLRQDEVAKAEPIGLQTEALYLYYSEDVLRRYNLDTTLLEGILSEANIISPSGFISVGDRHIIVQTVDNYTDVEDVVNAKLSVPGMTGNVRLGDMFRVEKSYIDPPAYLFRVNGKKAIGIGVSMREDGNIMKLGEQVKAVVADIQAGYPLGLEYNMIVYQPDYVKFVTDKFSNNLIQSILIVVGIILFILGLKMGLIAGVLIPVTIFASIFTMEKLGIGLDKISLSALIISLGILANNLIVIAEGSIANIKCGDKTCDAALSPAEKFQRPLIIATLIISCAFLPVYLAKSSMGEYAGALFIVVAITLFYSWFFSITLFPYLANLLFKGKDIKLKRFVFGKYFAPVIKIALDRPVWTVQVAVFAFLLSFVFLAFVPKIFFPDSDRPMFEVVLKLSDGSDIYATKKFVERTEEYLGGKEKIKSFSSYVGGSPPRYVLSSSPEPNKASNATILVNTKKSEDVKSLIDDVQKYCDENYVGVKTTVRKVPLGPPNNYPVQIRIFGKDQDEIFKIVNNVKDKLYTMKGVTQIADDWGDKISRIQVGIDMAHSLKYNISAQDVAGSLRGALEGRTITYYYRNVTYIPVYYRLDKAFANNIENISTMNIYSPVTKTCMPLSEIAKLSLYYEYPEIYRSDEALMVTIQAQIDKRITTAHKIIDDMRPLMDSIEFPPMYGWQVGGTVEDSKKGINSIIEQLPVAAMIILMILIFHFNSIAKPLIVLATAGLAMTGANIGLLITGSYFGFMTFLGYICLIGIAICNSIVLIDAIERDEKFDVQKAVRGRIVPICLTAFTAMGAILPMWLGNDSMFSSLAIVIIFGLMSSVAITLVVTPALYMLLIKRKNGELQSE